MLVDELKQRPLLASILYDKQLLDDVSSPEPARPSLSYTNPPFPISPNFDNFPELWAEIQKGNGNRSGNRPWDIPPTVLTESVSGLTRNIEKKRSEEKRWRGSMTLGCGWWSWLS